MLEAGGWGLLGASSLLIGAIAGLLLSSDSPSPICSRRSSNQKVRDLRSPREMVPAGSTPD
jgi:hypothetical protein